MTMLSPQPRLGEGPGSAAISNFSRWVTAALWLTAGLSQGCASPKGLHGGYHLSFFHVHGARYYPDDFGAAYYPDDSGGALGIPLRAPSRNSTHLVYPCNLSAPPEINARLGYMGSRDGAGFTLRVENISSLSRPCHVAWDMVDFGGKTQSIHVKISPPPRIGVSVNGVPKALHLRLNARGPKGPWVLWASEGDPVPRRKYEI